MSYAAPLFVQLRSIPPTWWRWPSSGLGLSVHVPGFRDVSVVLVFRVSYS